MSKGHNSIVTALLVLLVTSSTSAETITVADGNGADAWVGSDVPDEPLGFTDDLRMRLRSDGTQRKAYLRFDLSEFTFDTAFADSVTLSVFADEADDVFPNSVLAYGINDGAEGDSLGDWDEEDITFNTAPQVGLVGIEVGEETTLVSSYALEEPPGGGRVPFSGGDEFLFESTPDFVDFIRADTNDLVTLILIYKEPAGSSLGLETKEDGQFNPAALTVVPGAGGGGPALQPGDADRDLDFDQLDLVQVQIAAKYLTGQAATWGEGDWDGGPGGSQDSPPSGNGLFDQRDIIAALAAGKYLTGPYASMTSSSGQIAAKALVVYGPSTGRFDSAKLVHVPEPTSGMPLGIGVVLSLLFALGGKRRFGGPR